VYIQFTGTLLLPTFLLARVIFNRHKRYYATHFSQSWVE